MNLYTYFILLHLLRNIAMAALGYGTKLAVICEENDKSHKKGSTYFTVKPSSNIDCGFGNSTELKLLIWDWQSAGTTKAHGQRWQEMGGIENILSSYLVVCCIYIPVLTEESLKTRRTRFHQQLTNATEACLLSFMSPIKNLTIGIEIISQYQNKPIFFCLALKTKSHRNEF